MTRVVLASTSRYRRELLGRVLPDFAVDAPDVDETPIAGELPLHTAVRLAFAKAWEVAARHPGTIVIGSDQVAELDGRALGKPGSTEAARRQLEAGEHLREYALCRKTAQHLVQETHFHAAAGISLRAAAAQLLAHLALR